MSTHGGKWYACCGLGKGYHRLKHKRDRQAVKEDLRRGREPRVVRRSAW